MKKATRKSYIIFQIRFSLNFVATFYISLQTNFPQQFESLTNCNKVRPIPDIWIFLRNSKFLPLALDETFSRGILNERKYLNIIDATCYHSFKIAFTFILFK